jgi:calcineurin-like phosphoesterase family protein
MRCRVPGLLAGALWAASAIGAPQDVWTGVDRIIAIGDVHGDYAKLAGILQTTHLVDGKLRWTGGKTHLVITGDVLDRGPDSRKAMDLVRKLERDAGRAGGRVHMLIGNHEAMNVYGDLRYVSKEEYAAFQTRDSERLRSAYYERYLEDSKAAGQQPEDRAAWDSKHPLGFFEHRLAFSQQGDYGKWIRDLNTVVRINDSVFLHGGLSPKYASLSVREINERIRGELKDFSKLEKGLAMDPEGPLWYRGWADGEEGVLEPELKKVLAAYGVNRMVIGHTITRSRTVTPRFGGRVVMIDVGLSTVYSGRPGYLVYDDRSWHALDQQHRIAIPEPPRGN